MSAAKAISKIPFWKGAGFFLLLKRVLVIIAIISFLFSIYQVYQDTGQWELAAKELGSKMFNPLQELADHTKDIKDLGWLGEYDNLLFQGIWNWLVNVWGFIEPFIGVYFGYHLVRRLVRFFLFGTNSPIVITFFSLVGYVSLMEFYIGFFTELGPGAPFELTKQIFQNLKNSLG